MAEILLRVAPTRTGGQEIPGRLRFGEAIIVAEDGHEWSDWERTNPAWKIVAIPGVPAQSLNRLLDLYTDEERAQIIAGTWNGELTDGRRRAWRLNVFELNVLLANAQATAEFLATPSWEAATALNLIERWDAP